MIRIISLREPPDPDWRPGLSARVYLLLLVCKLLSIYLLELLLNLKVAVLVRLECLLDVLELFHWLLRRLELHDRRPSSQHPAHIVLRRLDFRRYLINVLEQNKLYARGWHRDWEHRIADLYVFIAVALRLIPGTALPIPSFAHAAG